MGIFNKQKNFSSTVEYIIAGLGNPGKEYEMTRHNAGFIAMDYIAKQLDCDLTQLKFKSYCACTLIGEKKVLLMKPQTYMNNSGQSVVEAMNFYKIKPENVIVLFDDISLDPGKMRIKRKGSDGGQRGMGNIIYLSGSDNFPRIKIGIGKKPDMWDLKDWVLSRFNRQDYECVMNVCVNILPALIDMTNGNIDKAMNRFN